MHPPQSSPRRNALKIQPLGPSSRPRDLSKHFHKTRTQFNTCASPSREVPRKSKAVQIQKINTVKIIRGNKIAACGIEIIGGVPAVPFELILPSFLILKKLTDLRFVYINGFFGITKN